MTGGNAMIEFHVMIGMTGWHVMVGCHVDCPKIEHTRILCDQDQKRLPFFARSLISIYIYILIDIYIYTYINIKNRGRERYRERASEGAGNCGRHEARLLSRDVGGAFRRVRTTPPLMKAPHRSRTTPLMIGCPVCHERSRL